MSYKDTKDAPQTFMQYDIAALQAMYGADFTSNSGNTSYRWNSTTGEMYIDGVSQGMTEKARIFLTIWDGGGNDTYDMSNYSSDALIDLAPGGVSRFTQNNQLADRTDYTKVNGNVYNAFQYKGDSRSLIENAIGGSGNDRILGNQANNVLQGMDGRDEILGGAGSDTLEGGAGDDDLLGGSGADVLRGGIGYDFASYYHASGAVVANLSNAGANTGEAAGDVYSSIEALGGSRFNDTLTGNWDGNNLYGHEGNDKLYGLGGRDYIVGGGGDDVLEGGADGDWLIGGAGTDFVAYTTGVTANLSDASQNTGEAAGDSYEGVEGIYGSNYADRLTGNAINNTIYGGWGEDMLSGLSGDDRLYAGDSNDNLVGGAGADVLDGGNGFDYAEYHTATSGVVVDLLNAWRNTGDAAGDSYVSIEGLSGSVYNDELVGSHAANELYGNGGWDSLEGRGGGDWMYGGAGYDFATYYSATAGVTANLSNSSGNTGDAAGDMYFEIEGLGGSSYADVLTGNSGYNELFGHWGNDMLDGLGDGDYLSGGEGNDLLVGGAGSDWLTGGNGSDTFRFDTALSASNVDIVNDFTTGSDVLQLTRNTFTAFANQASVYSWQFTYGSAATTWDHRLVYNSATGALSYDTDGVGGAVQIQFATLGKGLALSASSFALL
ncbi:calcium-binding protein [Microvirga sp. CF3062]|uniref:calcium-binding protein n=1 Tax=Microvirga sp. CF3062 TaxID=3110182 RepID=UPI002E78A73A|nr:calcium-binding protein [Microvirga sp. CF3062]MEE1657800.1 calcium-binding protein [Microvirga sp. CF3062]